MNRTAHVRGALAALLLLATAFPVPARGAGPDGNVEWNGLSHVGWQDRRPLAPVNRESFQVRLQAYQDDLTAVRVHWTDGAAESWIDAARIATRGPYDVWAATVPAAATDTPAYWFEVADGADADYLSASGISDAAPADGGFALDFATLSHAPLGATPASGGVVFRVWAPTSVSCYVRGDFNAWGLTNPLVKSGESFAGRVAGATAGQSYKYFFNNAVWNTDPAGRSLDPSNNLNARIVDPFLYAWSDGAFVTPILEKMVIYQLHVGTFAGRNDPAGSTPFPSRYVDVAARVGYLDSLGINTVMLNPITEFPGDLSAGYNPQTQWAPEWKYGTPDQLKALVDSLHAHGIAVLLDVVWNHFTTNDNFLWQYDGSQQWFDTPPVDTPWGSQADFDKLAVRDYFASSALLWLEEYHFDGFRADGTDYMNLPPQDAAGWALMQRLNDDMDRRWADKVAIAEQLPNDSWVTRPTSLGGAGFDSQYHDAFTDNLRAQIFAAAFGDPNMNTIRGILLGSGEYLTGRYATNYIELHDEAWPSSGGQRLVKTIDTTAPHDDVWAKGRVKLGQGVVLTAPGVPAFLMGAEWLEDTDFGADATHRIDWSKKATYAPIVAYFRALIHLRTSIDALRADSPIYVSHVNESGNLIAFRRYNGFGSEALVIANFSNTDYSGYRVGVPVAGDWTEAVNSQSAAYGGNGLDNPGPRATEAVPYDGFVQSLVLTVPQMGLLVLAPSGTLDAPRAGPGAPRGAAFTSVAPVPLRGSAAVSFALPAAGRTRLTVHDVGGRAIATLADGRFTSGEHTVHWNGRDARGAAVAAGVYFLTLEHAGQVAVRRVPVLR
jgi:1,4-alpha-glucan branching enzyme